MRIEKVIPLSLFFVCPGTENNSAAKFNAELYTMLNR